MTKAIVTGDAGFIGYHLTCLLLEKGYDVVGVDNLSHYYDIRLKRSRRDRLMAFHNYEAITMDLSDKNQIREIFAEHRPSVVFHLGAQAGVRYSLEHPDTYISSNIVGTFGILEAVREFPVEHLLLASTSSVYGGNTSMPFAETDKTDWPVSLYAATKKSVEVLAHSYSHLWRIPTTCFRFFTVYGPWGRPDMALYKFVRAIETGQPIDVYGEGKMLRDFTYVEDLVRSILELSEVAIPVDGDSVGAHDSLSPVAPFRTVNIAGGAPTGLLDFITEIERSTGRAARKNLMPIQPGDVVATHADPALLQSLIGEIPKTPVSIGVQRFVMWYREYYKSLGE